MRNDTVMPGRTATSRRRRRRPGIAAVLPVLGAVLIGSGLTGCSASSGDAGDAAHDNPTAAAAGWPDAVPKSGLAKGMVLPLEAYMETYPESVSIRRAIIQLETQCMAGYGFHISLPPPGLTPPPNNDDSNMERRYGITDRSKAAKLAYTLGDENRTPPPAPKLSDAEIAVLTGHVAMKPGAAKAPSTYQGKAVPDGGCGQQAADQVGAARIDNKVVGQADADSLDKSQADPRVQAVITAWSRCMKSSGYTVDTPLDAAKLVQSLHGGGVSAADIQVATTDIDCKAKTDLVKTWFTVESDIQRQQIEQNQFALQDGRNRITAAVKAAAAVTG
ncbi:hypothetical protein ACIGXA_39700 [Streptomyces fildesensis]|uniref:Lipoprotein n=1 Tax=Streptomyces fildesensis TaxID=375757 RepID=A0ABW8CJK7_9ACTN